MEAAQILDRVVARFIGTKHERDIKKLQPIIAAINAQEAEVQALSDAQLKERFSALRTQVQEQLKDADPAEPSYKEELQKALGPVTVPAFALVREAGRRFLRMRHFDVQLIGGMVLNDGKIAEMKTGEGKTLVATLPAALNALAWPRRSPGDGERLPGPARRGVDEPPLQGAGIDRRRDRA